MLIVDCLKLRTFKGFIYACKGANRDHREYIGMHFSGPTFEASFKAESFGAYLSPKL